MSDGRRLNREARGPDPRFTSPGSMHPMASTRFTPEQVDAAIDFVVDHGAIDRAQTIRYTAVFDAAGLPHPQDLHLGGDSDVVTRFMEAFHYRCSERGLPQLDALVVHVAGLREGLPGAGYFRVNGFKDPRSLRTSPEDAVRATQHWEAEVDQVKQWGVRRRRGRA